MTIHNVCKIIRGDSAYADYAVISFYTCPDIVTGDAEEFYAECGHVEHGIPLYSSIDFERLESTKNAVINYLNEHSHFLIFDYDAHRAYHDTPDLEGFIMRSLEKNSYSCNLIKRNDVFNIVKKIFSEIKPTPSSNLGSNVCVVS
jgi:hypothetical protein